MATKKTTKKRVRKTAKKKRPVSARQSGTAKETGGGGLEDGPSQTTPYPSVGDNPEFADFARGEIGPAGSSGNQGADVEGQGESAKPALGRPPGTGKHQKAAKALNEFQAAGINETIMASVFRGAFQAVAFALDEKAINLSTAEAEAFARPACVLWGYYMPETLTPVQAAWSQLLMVSVGVLGARSAALSAGWRKRIARNRGRDARATESPAVPPTPTPPPESSIPKPGKVHFRPDGKQKTTGPTPTE